MFLFFSRQLAAKSYLIQAEKQSKFPNSRCPQRGNVTRKRQTCLFCLTAFFFRSLQSWKHAQPPLDFAVDYCEARCSPCPSPRCFCTDTFISLQLTKGLTGPPSQRPICDCCRLPRQGSSRKIILWHQLDAPVVIVSGISVSQIKLSQAQSTPESSLAAARTLEEELKCVSGREDISEVSLDEQAYGQLVRNLTSSNLLRHPSSLCQDPFISCLT